MTDISPLLWNPVAGTFPLVTLIFQAGLLLGVSVGFIQLRLLRKNRNLENFCVTITRLNDHNRYIGENEARRCAIDIFLGLTPDLPPKVTAHEIYWATRINHLGNLNNLQQVFILSGLRRPGWLRSIIYGPNQFKKLRGNYAGWQGFAELLVAHLRHAPESGLAKPYRDACGELWRGVNAYEIFPPDFVLWLNALPEPRGIPVYLKQIGAETADSRVMISPTA